MDCSNCRYPALFLKLLIIGCLVLASIVVLHKKGLFAMDCTINGQSLKNFFPTTQQEVKDLEQQTYTLIDTKLNEILAIPDDQRTFANTVQAMDSLETSVAFTLQKIHMLTYVNPDKALQEFAQKTAVELQQKATTLLSTNVKLYKAFMAYVNNNKETLTQEQQRFVVEQQKAYKHLGLELPEEQLEQVRKTMQELAVLQAQFDMNIAQATCSIILTPQELSGIAPHVLATQKRTEDGNYDLGCDYPIYFAVMETCEVASTRKAMYLAFNNKAYPANLTLLNQIIAQRDHLAKLLGFADYSSYDLYLTMAQTPATVYPFLENVAKRSTKKAEQEFNEWTKTLPASVQLTADKKIQPWDVLFIKETYKKNNLAINMAQVQEYFPAENTLTKIFAIYQQFFGLTFKETTVSLWIPGLQLLDVYKEGKKIGTILLDLHPRDNKYSHACCSMIVPPLNNKQDAFAVVIANFAKPTADTPALLSFNDVVTFFHEFGHAMHALLGSDVTLQSWAGYNTKMDFVEMPSQMLENWFTDPGMIQAVSKHYKTSQQMPLELATKLANIEGFDAGYVMARQASFAFLSLACFGPGAKKDPVALSKEFAQKMLPMVAWAPENHFVASFGHLTNYGAKYYGYLWSKVFASDLFTVIKQAGMSPEIGKRYAALILAPGGSKDPQDMLKEFLGRNPDEKAFFNQYGL